MIPTFVPAGVASMKARAAASAACARVGSTSVADIEPDVSSKMKTWPAFEGSGSDRRSPVSAMPRKSAAATNAARSAAGIQALGWTDSTKNGTLE